MEVNYKYVLNYYFNVTQFNLTEIVTCRVQADLGYWSFILNLLRK